MIDPDAAARAMFDSFEVLTVANPRRSLTLGRSGVGSINFSRTFAMFNGVVTVASQPDPVEVSRVAEQFANAGRPWSIQLRGTPSRELVEVATRWGATGRAEEPLMARILPLAPVSAVAGFDVRIAQPADSARYLDVLARGSETSPSSLTDLASPVLLADPRVRPYLGFSGDSAVATGMTTRSGSGLGLLNIATVPAARRHGYAAAVTARATADAHSEGVSLAVLQANPPAVSLYRRLGFEVVETWTYLIAAPRTS